MNFAVTSEVLDVLKLYVSNANITISTENKDWKNRRYKSDFVVIDEKNNVGFEVMDNEIIVFYFTDHYHFEDYTSEIAEGEDDYITRAKEFLLELFRYKIRHVEIFKGKTLALEKYYIMYQDGKEDRYIGGTWFGFCKLINPFRKKTRKATVWSYAVEQGCFSHEVIET